MVCGYGEVGFACLDELLQLGAEIPLVVTHRDSPDETIWFRSVAARACEAGIRVLSPDDLNAAPIVAEIEGARPDLLFSFYCRQMISPRVLAIPRGGALNLHGSLLPRYRGRAPVNWVLIHGESETGVTLHYMDSKPDHGDIVAQRIVPIDREDDALSLTRKIAVAARELLRETYPLLLAGRAPRRPQDHLASSYFGGRTAADGEIDWRRDAESIRNLVRAVTAPWPGAFGFFRGRKLYVWRAETVAATAPSDAGVAPGQILPTPDGRLWVATGNGLLELVEVGERSDEHQSGRAWAARERVAAGERFEQR